MDQLPRLGKRELICLLLFTCNYVVFVWRGFLFLWVLGMGYVILLWHSLSLPYSYFSERFTPFFLLVYIDIIFIHTSIFMNLGLNHFNKSKHFSIKVINILHGLSKIS